MCRAPIARTNYFAILLAGHGDDVFLDEWEWFDYEGGNPMTDEFRKIHRKRRALVVNKRHADALALTWNRKADNECECSECAENAAQRKFVGQVGDMAKLLGRQAGLWDEGTEGNQGIIDHRWLNDGDSDSDETRDGRNEQPARTTSRSAGAENPIATQSLIRLLSIVDYAQRYSRQLKRSMSDLLGNSAGGTTDQHEDDTQEEEAESNERPSKRSKSAAP